MRIPVSVHHYVTCYSGFMISGASCIWGPADPPAKTITRLVPGYQRRRYRARVRLGRAQDAHDEQLRRRRRD